MTVPVALPVPAIKGPFAVSLSIPVPEKVAKTASASRPPLPYADYLDGLEANAKAGQQPHFFIPCSFYKDRPGVKYEKVTPSYVRSKIREFFNKWRSEDASREPLYLTLIPRDGVDAGSVAMATAMSISPEPGVSVWMMVSATPASS